MTKTITEVIGAEYTENTTNLLLKYILDPKEDHGFGDYFLKLFLSYIGKKYKSYRYLLQIVKNDLRNCKVEAKIRHKTGKIPDLEIISIEYNFVVCIEMKVKATENKDKNGEFQTDIYSKIINNEFNTYNKICLYLTPNGKYPKCIEFKPLTFFEINENIIKNNKFNGTNASLIELEHLLNFTLIDKSHTILPEININDSIPLLNKELEEIRKILRSKTDEYIFISSNSYLLMFKPLWLEKSQSSYQKGVPDICISLYNYGKGKVCVKSEENSKYFKYLSNLLRDTNLDNKLKINSASISHRDYKINIKNTNYVVDEMLRCVKEFEKSIDNVYELEL